MDRGMLALCTRWRGRMIDLLRSRRSVRVFEEQPVEPETVKLLREALLRSPSSRNLRPWEFILVDDPRLLEGLGHARPTGSRFLAGAPLSIVVCGDERSSDTWVEDCSIAAILVQLTAHSLGLGSCWAQIRGRPHSDDLSAEAFVQDLLGLPTHLRVECIIGLGHPGETRPSIPASKLDGRKIHHNCYDPGQTSGERY
jgi:nitroreductase